MGGGGGIWGGGKGGGGGRITMLVVGWLSSYHHELHRHRYSILPLPRPFHFRPSLRNNDTPIKSGVCFASRRFEEKEMF